VVERKNRTLEDMDRTMLWKSSLPISFWVEAVIAGNYVLNRCLIHPIFKKIPYELFKCRKPNIFYFRTFGCKCFIYNNGKERIGNLMLEVIKVFLLVIPCIVKLFAFIISVLK